MTPILGAGNPGHTKLNLFGAFIRSAYGETPYLVGSATRGKQWRDVDIRLVLDDDRFDAQFSSSRPFDLGARWSLITASISALGEQMTGLPIDFQIQPRSYATERHGDQIRIPLGLWIPDEWENQRFIPAAHKPPFRRRLLAWMRSAPWHVSQPDPKAGA